MSLLSYLSCHYERLPFVIPAPVFFSHFTGTTEIFCTTCLYYQCQAFTREKAKKYFVNDTTQFLLSMRKKKIPVPFDTKLFHRNFLTNAKRKSKQLFVQMWKSVKVTKHWIAELHVNGLKPYQQDREGLELVPRFFDCYQLTASRDYWGESEFARDKENKGRWAREIM